MKIERLEDPKEFAIIVEKPSMAIKCEHIWFHSMDMSHNICGSCNVHEIWKNGKAHQYRAEECPNCIRVKREKAKRVPYDL